MQNIRSLHIRNKHRRIDCNLDIDNENKANINTNNHG
jgi:hypothetical protein